MSTIKKETEMLDKIANMYYKTEGDRKRCGRKSGIKVSRMWQEDMKVCYRLDTRIG